MTPRSWCVACHRPFYSDKRRPCRCGETGRAFNRSAADGIKHVDKAS